MMSESDLQHQKLLNKKILKLNEKNNFTTITSVGYHF